MSSVYDNWERLVAAVLKREEIRELCHASSRASSTSSVPSDFSSSSSSRLNGNLKSAKSEIQESDYQIEREWVEEYEAGVGVRITLAAFKDGRFEIKRVCFSQRKFTEKEAETWWLNNREKVYKKYSKYSEKLSSRNKNAQTQNVLKKSEKSKHSEVGGRGGQIVDEWLELYEPGIYVDLQSLSDGSKDAKRVRFSRRIFSEDQARAWWLKNREKVYEKYNVRVELPYWVI